MLSTHDVRPGKVGFQVIKGNDACRYLVGDMTEEELVATAQGETIEQQLKAALTENKKFSEEHAAMEEEVIEARRRIAELQ